jgi:hypothetical protein
MKKILYILMSAIASFGFASCSDNDFDSGATPELDVTVSSNNLAINHSMELKFTGVSDQIVVFTGDNLHNYALKDSSNTGFVVNKGLFTYSYSTPGNFHVVCIASTYDRLKGTNQQTIKKEFDVTVIDTINTIDKIYSKVTPNVYYANLANNRDWVLCIPTKQVYSAGTISRDIVINAKKLRLSMDISSDSAHIAIDGVEFSTKTYYDLTTTHDITVTPNSGSTRNYKLYTMIYPEFTKIAVAGVSGVLTRDAYYQDLQTYTFTLPSGTDVSSVVPDFTIDSNVKLYANGTEVKAGSPINLNDNSVTYTLKRVLEGNSDVTATSRINFVVKNK